MALYHYQSGSLIDSAQILTNEMGGKRAYLHAAEDASSEQLRKGKQAIRAMGYKCVPIVHEGKPALEVRGFKTNEDCLKALADAGLASGATPAVTPEAGDEPDKKTSTSKKTLKIAGISYVIGDAMFFYSKGGPLREDWHKLTKSDRFFGIFDLVAGIGYALGSLTLGIFGSRDQSLNTIEAATKKIERYARKEGLAIAPEASIAFTNEDEKLSPTKKAARFLDKYPSETFNGIYIGVGAALAAAAAYRGFKPIEKGLIGKELKHAMESRKEDRLDIGLGVMTALSGIVGISVKEKKPLPGDPKPEGIVGNTVAWIQEKPLRASGIGYMFSTAFHGVTTAKKWRSGTEKKKWLIGRVGFIALNVVSEIMLAISSKGHGTGVKPDESVDKSVIATTAELIQRQPEAKREALIEQFSGYMASADVLGISAEHIASEMRRHISALKASPWTKHYVQTKSGELKEVEAAPQAVQSETHEKHGSTTASHDEIPGTRISHAKYDAKHLTPEHALAAPAMA